MYSKAIIGLIMVALISVAAWSQDRPDWERRYDCMLSGETIAIDCLTNKGFHLRINPTRQIYSVGRIQR